ALFEAAEGDESEAVRLKADVARKKVGPPTADHIGPLLEDLKDKKNPAKRAAAAQCLRLVGREAPVVILPALLERLAEDGHVGVRVSAARALWALDRSAGPGI